MAEETSPAGTPRRRRLRSLFGFKAFEQFFLAVAPDVTGMLVAQGELSVEAMAAFERWSRGDVGPDGLSGLKDLEQACDDARRRLMSALRGALATPINQEDLYVLSERCDRVVNAARDIAAEATDLGWAPDPHAAEMARCLSDGMVEIVRGFSLLRTDPGGASAAADGAVRHAHRVEHAYRVAMADLLKSPDLLTVFTTREIYRRYGRSAELLIALGDRLWYSVLAEA